MKSERKGILSRLDDTVRWTGMPARVAEQMSPDHERRHRLLRWTPMWSIAFALALLVISVIWPRVLEGMNEGIVFGVMTAFWGGMAAMMTGVHANGPLGKSSLEDDERESALRKDSFLFSLGWLAVLNGLGQPIFMILSHWQDWKLAQIVCVVTSAVMLNIALLGSLPTLYASWKLQQLPEEPSRFAP